LEFGANGLQSLGLPFKPLPVRFAVCNGCIECRDLRVEVALGAGHCELAVPALNNCVPSKDLSFHHYPLAVMLISSPMLENTVSSYNLSLVNPLKANRANGNRD
jgi:hypothetical protein